MKSPRVARVSLVLLCASALSIGLVATVAPRSFYDDFPFFASWVELLPPYNEHLVTDVGGLYLGFALMLAFAAWTLEATLVRAVACAWLLSATIHLGYHSGHLDGFSTADAIGELISLGFLVLLPALVLLAARPRPSA